LNRRSATGTTLGTLRGEECWPRLQYKRVLMEAVERRRRQEIQG
jgi:hypothetical protein